MATRKPKDPRFQDLEGMKFSCLTVLSYYGKIEKERRHSWVCQCDCGNETVVTSHRLKNGNTRSCGCLKIKALSERSRTHGESKSSQNGRETPEYKAWCHIKGRCHNPSNAAWDNYGGRGIKVCDRWRYSYETFLSDMGRRPSRQHSIDRIDNDGDYSPENCRWATKTQQNRNTRTNRILTLNGKSQCLPEWADDLGIPVSVLHQRLSRGWNVERTLLTPARNWNKASVMNALITWNGQTATMKEWADKFGLTHNAMKYRIDKGWSFDRIACTPMQKRRKKPAKADT